MYRDRKSGADGNSGAEAASGPRADGAAAVPRRTLLRGASTLLMTPTLASAARTGSPPPARAAGGYTLRAGWTLVGEPLSHPREVGSTAGLQLLRDVHVLVRDGRIEAIRREPFREPLPHLDLPGDLLLPGFISGHTHCCSATPTRGIIETPRSYRRPLELVEELADDELDALTALNLAELIRSGCTTQVEMSLSLRQAESYVRVARRFGARGYPGAMSPGIDRLFPIWFREDDDTLARAEQATLDEIARNVDFCRRHRDADGGLLRPMLSPHACDTHTPATLAALAAGARELGTGVHIHLSQGARETATVRRLHGLTPTQWLEKSGVLAAGPVFGAHMSGLDWDVDPPILRRHGVVYAHCPSAGGAGGDTQPFPEALAAGIAVNIGIDTHSNDYLENLKLAVLFGQARHELLRSLGSAAQPTVRPGIWDAVDGATRVAARGLRRDDLGVLRPGARADLVSIDVSGLLVGAGALPPEPLNNLLYANGRMVRTVMTEGRLQVANGEFIAADVAPLLAAGGEVVSGLWQRLADEGWFLAT